MYTYLKSNVEVFDPEYQFHVVCIDEVCVGSCVGTTFNFIVYKCWYMPVQVIRLPVLGICNIKLKKQINRVW